MTCTAASQQRELQIFSFTFFKQSEVDADDFRLINDSDLYFFCKQCDLDSLVVCTHLCHVGKLTRARCKSDFSQSSE